MSDKKRLHYGVMFSTMDNANQYEVWRGIDAFAAEKDIHLTAYIGTYQVAGGPVTSFLDTCFETAATSSFLDGIIVMSGFVAQDAGVEKFSEYMAKIQKNVPVVSVSLPFPGVPGVMAESFGGMYDTVAHLITVHGKKQIAFVKGTDGHPEAEARLEGYKQALEDNGIGFDERYVVQGYFNPDSGVAAVSTLVDKLKIPFDAIAASNDQMAIGALGELYKRNILVPSDVAVTGFDDDVNSASLIPSLSTAQQDFFEIGRVGAGMLYDLINRQHVDESNNVAPIFIARQSCGCLEKEYAESPRVLAEKATLNEFVFENFRTLFTNVPKGPIAAWSTILVRAIGKSPFSQEKFLFLFNEILIKYNHAYKNILTWNAALNVLSTGIELYQDEIENRYVVHSAFIAATAFVQDIRAKEEKNKQINEDGARRLVRRITSELVLTFDVDSLIDKLYSSLPEMALDTALVGVYRKPIKPGDVDADRTVVTLIGFDGDRKFNMPHNEISFSHYTNFDHFGMDRMRRSMFFLPLFFEDDELGVLMLPYDEGMLIDAYDTLRISVATAIKGAELLSTIRTLSITDELTGLLNRRGFFQFVYARIFQLSRFPSAMPMVMFMDMDGLKVINDTYGHNEGDAAISTFAKILKDALRKEDIIGRIGGDEFVVFSSVKSHENGLQVVQRIRDKLAEYNARGLHPYAVSSSIGSVMLEAVNRECFEEAMLNADSVLYEEKQKKREAGLARG
ncbi:MAG: GGDEF domain-containing protein [Defluviitaleaceae bacterium]|nr:GGDEF domain-containing protein [Defluviitaleaceae bacterium]